MMIYDCFTFDENLDLLELRLDTLYEYVDYFVLVESTTDIFNVAKPYYFEKNLSRYSKYLNKVIHVQINDSPCSQDPDINRNYQIDSIVDSFGDSHDNDIIVISDENTIVKPGTISILKNSTDLIFGLSIFEYTGTQKSGTEIKAMSSSRQVLKDIVPSQLLGIREDIQDWEPGESRGGVSIIKDAGWSFKRSGDIRHLDLCRAIIKDS